MFYTRANCTYLDRTYPTYIMNIIVSPRIARIYVPQRYNCPVKTCPRKWEALQLHNVKEADTEIAPRTLQLLFINVTKAHIYPAAEICKVIFCIQEP